MTPLRFQVGDVQAYLVSDGVFWVDGGTAFGVVPRVLWEQVIEPDRLHRVPMELRCLLIESDEGLILVDTGYGDKLSARQRDQLALEGERRLIGELATLGYRPEDVRLVVNTHLHADHCGGNTIFDADGRAVPTFPNARYLVQRLELADATFPNERTRNTYFGENFLPLGDPRRATLAGSDGALRMLHGDAWIASGVRTMITPGHTRSHQAVIIESLGETAVFLADAAAWAVSLERLAWVPAFDVEPLASIETKHALRDWAFRKDALLLFQHDMGTPAGRLRSDGERWSVEPAIPEMDW
ncbi:MAG: hypothetical protein CVU38_04700 [Chloroflexi bacterium HGW-Chloroflexi-1]|nr:MAG: hypothetical protein CVU38_04700 [Chloroflexi bacterium HGW-Chloroflexi-1]